MVRDLLMMQKEGWHAMHTLVTGVAGFIGSSLAERLVAEGHEVVGVDCFTPYYARSLKEHNLLELRERPNFTFIEGDLNALDLRGLLDGVAVVFHQAAQAGVLASWGASFQTYVDANIRATQHLLEAARDLPDLARLVYASSSSVYGNTPDLPARETGLPAPVSPYGVTKLAGEHLCNLYAANFGVPTVSLRYFTVYGPRQRPDMGIHKFIRAALTGAPITIYGDGTQTRDFTYINDIVEANLAAATRPLVPGGVYNTGGGSRITVNDLVALIQELAGSRTEVRYIERQAGDAEHTAADLTAARRDLDFAPQVGHRAGLAAQIAWQRAGLAEGWL
jgi:nucleoside-diphosphate-sugar epimerase